MNGRFLVIGCGSMGRRRIRHLGEMTQGEVWGWDIRPDRRAEVERLFGISTFTRREDLDGQDFTAAFISVPPSVHEQYIDWAIARRLPFMVEQPVTDRLERVAAIREAVVANGQTVHVSNNHRHSARIKLIKALIDSGELGRPLTGIVEIGEWLPDWHSYEPYTDYYPSKRSMGGGLDAVCDLDWLRHLFGEVREAKAMGTIKSDLEIDTFDVAQFLMDFESGPQVVLHTDMLQRPYTAALKLVFAKGTIMHRMPEPTLKVFRWDEQKWSEIPLEEDIGRFPSMQGKEGFNFVEPMYFHDTAYFLDRLAKGDASPASLDSGIENLKVIRPLV